MSHPPGDKRWAQHRLDSPVSCHETPCIGTVVGGDGHHPPSGTTVNHVLPIPHPHPQCSPPSEHCAASINKNILTPGFLLSPGRCRLLETTVVTQGVSYQH